MVGIVSSLFVGSWRRNPPIKSPYSGRIGLAWIVLLAYGALWVGLLFPWEMMHTGGWHEFAPLIARKVSAYAVTVCMFAYVALGLLLLDRFLLFLGLLVTLTTLFGYFFISDYFQLWVAATGGGSLLVSGLFVRKTWR